jgi:hypothetical protein
MEHLPSASPDRPEPLTEIFYFTHGGRWPVGRHIDRGNTIGMVRLEHIPNR